ncbi:EVE domain-containing protein [Gallaecimonas kandeliae]|uniref:EVE domain-containing protein n=1 Tax=Gallaecimonas kandeliae TaxID=3029055 RepID=UPI002649611F|nr:EVE domain-containing protein [Gallaecimonas kandeliae]WKE64048.1 EVE domain-containing protein [Gallaecimonas kandeliae]
MRYWIGVASKDHVERGVAGGFCQLCHGKAQPLKRMSVGDWILYYSPRETFEEASGEARPCQQFTAIGEVVGAEAYPFEMAPGFVPHRRDIRFLDSRAVPIRPLLEQLSFIRDKGRWGYAFRFGHLEIPRADFELIAKAMLGRVPD